MEAVNTEEDERDMRVKEELKIYKRICHSLPYRCKFVIVLQHVAKNMAFRTSDKWGQTWFGVEYVPNIQHLAHIAHLLWVLLDGFIVTLGNTNITYNRTFVTFGDFLFLFFFTHIGEY